MAQYRLVRPWASAPGVPFGELRREMDALFNRFGEGSVMRGSGVFPAVNLYETGDAYVLTAELPGVKPDAIQVSLRGTTVTLHGERHLTQPEGVSVHRRERQEGAFRRAFELPVPIDSDKAEARHRNGVLMLRLPKAQEHQPRHITVQAS